MNERGSQQSESTDLFGEVLDPPVLQTTASGSADAPITNPVEEERNRLFNLSIDMLCVAAFDGYFKQVNPAWTRTLGWAEIDLLSYPWLDFVHPDDREQTRANARQLLAGKEVMGFENRFRCRDGSYRWLSWNSFPLPTERLAFSVVRDFTESRWAQNAMRESEARFRLLAENSTDLISQHTTDGTFLYASPACRAIVGYEPEEMVGHSPYEYLHPEDVPLMREAHRHVLEGRDPMRVTLRARCKDGHYTWIETSGHIIRDPLTGAVTEIHASTRDVTQRKKLEEDLRQALKMEAVGQLAGGVAHDLNNTLTVIQGHAGLLMDRLYQSPEAAKSIKQIADASLRAASITRQLLTFSRKQPMQMNRLDLSEVVSELTGMLRRVTGETIDLQCKYWPGPLQVCADRAMLGQAVLNLAVNARDAMPEGGRLTLTTELHKPDRAWCERHPGAREGDCACLVVADTGMGMTPEVLPHLFEPFFTTKDVGKGTGLGLAAVYGIVQQHNGSIEVESTPGQGSRFKVFLPLAAPEPAVVQPSSPPVAAEAMGGHETILVVEDEEALLRFVSTCLRRSGYQVLEAAKGTDALRVWQESGGKVDLLLTDMVMPDGMSGRVLSERLLEEKPTLRVVFTSGYTMGTGDDLRLAEGVNYLPKPYEPGQLLRILRNRLDSAPGAPPTSSPASAGGRATPLGPPRCP